MKMRCKCTLLLLCLLLCVHINNGWIASRLPASQISKRLAKSRLFFKVSEKEVVAIVDKSSTEIDEVSSNDIELLQKVSKGIIPVAASLGFAMTPSSSVLFRLLGATLGGLGGFVTKRYVLENIIHNRENVLDGNDNKKPPYSVAVEKALRFMSSNDKTINSDLKSLEKIAKTYNVSSKELAILLTHLFAELLYSTTQSESNDLTELMDVIDFAERVQLTTSEIGDGFALAIIKLSRDLDIDERGFFSTNYSPMHLLQAAKLFFLADKIVGNFQGFYGKRVSSSLHALFLAEQYDETLTRASKSMFKQIVEKVLNNPASFSAEEVELLRTYLVTTNAQVSSFRSANMQNMIMESIQYNVDQSLVADHENVDARNAAIANYENLEKAQDVLGWKRNEFTKTVETKTLPVLEKAFREAVTNIFVQPDNGPKYEGFFQGKSEANRKSLFT